MHQVLVEDKVQLLLCSQTFTGTTNLQTMTIQVSRGNNNGGGNMQGQDGFIVAKEVAGGITTGTPSNNYVN